MPRTILQPVTDPADAITEVRSVRVREITAETAQTLVAITVASMLLLAAVAATALGGAAGWAAALVTALVTWQSVALVTAVRSRDSTERRLADRREAMRELARDVEAAATAVHDHVEAARTAVIAGVVIDPSATAMALDRADQAIDDIAAVAAALAEVPVQPEVVEVGGTARRALWGLDAEFADHPPAFAHTSRHAFQTALRLIATGLDTEGTMTVTIHASDGMVRSTISTDDAGLETGDAEALFGDGPPPTFAGREDLHRLSLARRVARHGGGDVSYVRALGRSNYVVAIPSVDTGSAEATPPILTLALPLDPVEGPAVAAGARR